MLLHYQLWNQTGKPLSEVPKLLLLHGMGGTGALWRPIASAFETTHAVLAPDQRGHGKSRVALEVGARTQPSYTPLDYGSDLLDTLAHLAFFPSWIVGHSMGVRSAVAIAHLKPQWVQGLILVDLGFSGVAGGGLGENLAGFLKKLPLTFENRDEAREFMTTECPDPSIAQYLMAVSVKDAEDRITFPFDRSALIQTIHAARDISVRKWVEEMGSLQKPVLVLRGAQSKVWSHEEFERESTHFAQWSSIIFKEVPNAGHGLPFEQRIAFVEAIKAFQQAYQP